MTALPLNHSLVRRWSTPSVENIFQKYSIPALASLRVRTVGQNALTLAEQLNEARHMAQTIVRNWNNVLDPDISRRMLARLSELLDEESWDEDDLMPERQSTETLVGLIATAPAPFTSLSISAGGALKATWIIEGRTITAVAKKDSLVSWSKVEETTNGFNTKSNEGPIADFLAAFGN